MEIVICSLFQTNLIENTDDGESMIVNSMSF